MSNQDLEAVLETLPDLVSEALEKWRMMTLEREKVEALTYMAAKGSDEKRTATELKAIINSSPERYEAVLAEVKAECEYQRLYERLLATKRRAALRTAF